MRNETKNNIHILIYSRLEANGGGRETWINYFLSALAEEMCFDKIYIYCLDSNDYKNTIRYDLEKYNQIIFFPSKIKYDNNGVMRKINFINNSVYNIAKCATNNDVVISMGTIMEGICSLFMRIKSKKKLKFILWIRSIGLKELSTRRNILGLSILKVIEAMCFNLSSAVIFNGKDTYDYYIKLYYKMKSKMHVVENAVEYKAFSNIDKLQFIDNTINITYIGRFNKEKGFIDFLESIRRYNLKNMDNLSTKIRFNIWGFGMDLPKLDNMIYHGKLERQNIYNALKDSHIIVFLNLSGKKLAGGLSHGLLEALASGRLCLAYSNPAHNQILNQHNSVLISEENIDELVNKYCEIVNDINDGKFNHYLELATNGQSVVENYSIENHVNKFLKIYKSIM